MNNKITYQLLVEEVASAGNIDKEIADKVLKELFSSLGDALAEGESVKLKGIGSFKVSGVEPRESVNVATGERVVIPGHRKISFTADKVIAEEVNQPFALLETAEIPDNVTDSELETPAEDENTPSSTAATEQSLPDTSQAPNNIEIEEPILPPVVWSDEEPTATQLETSPEPQEPAEPDQLNAATPEEVQEVDYETTETENNTIDTNGETTQESEETAEESIPAPIAASETTDDAEANEEDELYEEDYPQHRRSKLGLGILIGALSAILLIAAGIFAWAHFAPASFGDFFKIGGTATPVVAAKVAATEPAKQLQQPAAPTSANQPKDSIVNEAVTTKESESKEDIDKVKDEVQTHASDQPVYDYISKKRYLTTMAKEHYGDYNLWPYIYEENKAILGHPDHIRPGTRVVIPPASKYGIDAKNKACVDAAKKKGIEIYARYK